MRNLAPSIAVNVFPSLESEQLTEQPRGRSLTDRGIRRRTSAGEATTRRISSLRLVMRRSGVQSSRRL